MAGYCPKIKEIHVRHSERIWIKSLISWEKDIRCQIAKESHQLVGSKARISSGGELTTNNWTL